MAYNGADYPKDRQVQVRRQNHQSPAVVRHDLQDLSSLGHQHLGHRCHEKRSGCRHRDQGQALADAGG